MLALPQKLLEILQRDSWDEDRGNNTDIQGTGCHSKTEDAPIVSAGR